MIELSKEDKDLIIATKKKCDNKEMRCDTGRYSNVLFTIHSVVKKYKGRIKWLNVWNNVAIYRDRPIEDILEDTESLINRQWSI